MTPRLVPPRAQKRPQRRAAGCTRDQETRAYRVSAGKAARYLVRKPNMRSANLPYGGIMNFRLEKRA